MPIGDARNNSLREAHQTSLRLGTICRDPDGYRAVRVDLPPASAERGTNLVRSSYQVIAPRIGAPGHQKGKRTVITAPRW